MKYGKALKNRKTWVAIAVILLVGIIVVQSIGKAYSSPQEANAATTYAGELHEIIGDEIAVFLYTDAYGGLSETVVAAKQRRGWTTGGRGARVQIGMAGTRFQVLFYSTKSYSETIVIVTKIVSNEELAALGDYSIPNLPDLVSVMDNQDTEFVPLTYEIKGTPRIFYGIVSNIDDAYIIYINDGEEMVAWK